MKVEKREYSSY